MGRHKKQQFIDKKNAVTFHLVHRSQKDPLQADEDSSKFVLQETINLNEKKVKDEKRKEQQRKYGVFFEDEYDYTQHLRETQPENVTWYASPSGGGDKKKETKIQFQDEDKPKAKIQLPADIFPSEKEEDIGLLNRAAPISGLRLDLDPDLVAAMDEDFDMDDPDNLLEDDFILKAQDLNPLEAQDGLGDGNSDYMDSDVSSDGEFEREEEFDDEEEETKTKFTNYSLSSSVIKRNEGLTLLDDRFEKIYEEYDDMEMGALDHDDIEGFCPDNGEILNQALEEFEKSQKKLVLEKQPKGEDNLLENDEDDSDNDDDLIKMKYEERKKETWDCESILSTYSNLYNHPKIIEDPPRQRKEEHTGNGTIRLSQKTGIPLGVLPTPGPTKKQMERQELEEYRLPLVVTPRKKGEKENAGDKRDRKQAVKVERKIRRMEKKANKEAFKEEEKTQKKIMMNVRNNIKGVKIS